MNCQHCDQVFSTKNNLDKHRKRIHQAHILIRYKQSIIGKITGVNDGQFYCPCSKKSYNYPSHLQKHALMCMFWLNKIKNNNSRDGVNEMQSSLTIEREEDAIITWNQEDDANIDSD